MQLSYRAVFIWHMSISNFVEKMYLFFGEKEGGGDRVYGRVAPSLVIEFPSPVEE